MLIWWWYEAADGLLKKKRLLIPAGILKQINTQQASSHNADEMVLQTLQYEVVTTMHKQSTTKDLAVQRPLLWK